MVNEEQPVSYKEKRMVHRAIVLTNRSEATINSANQVMWHVRLFRPMFGVWRDRNGKIFTEFPVIN